MPARHLSHQAVCFSKRIPNRKALVDERGCRRDIRSNGRIAVSDGVRSFRKTVRQKNQHGCAGILQSVRSSCSAIPPAAFAEVEFAPDVFADALVLHAGAVCPRRHDPRKSSWIINGPVEPRGCSHGYWFADARVNQIPPAAELGWGAYPACSRRRALQSYVWI